MAIVEVPKKWDHEADVVVVGGGTAGLPAGIIVAEAGLKATVLETRASCGGSFKMVAGGFVTAGSEEQKEQGINDSPDILYEDLINYSDADPEIARAYVDNHLEAYKMLKDEGIKFPRLNPLPCHSRVRSLSVSGLGPKLVQAAEKRARDRGVEILFKHRATRLITSPETGRILGLKVKVGEETKNFKANRAVILTSGGFGRNREMIAEYSPSLVDCIPMMPPSHLGDGLKMGMAEGAATKDIHIAVEPAWPVCVETHSNAVWVLNWGGIMVNVNGKRFHNESQAEGYYGPMTGAGMKQPGSVYWIVYDEKIKEEKGGGTAVDHQVKAVEKCKHYQADTIEELAKSIGIDADGLKETIDKFNSDIDSEGYDTVFDRKYQLGKFRSLIKIETPPFYSIKCVTSMTSMKGGLKINSRGQVLNQYGEEIPGLYAAGEVTGGLHTKTYLLAVMSSSAFTQGIIAGRNAAEEPTRE